MKNNLDIYTDKLSLFTMIIVITKLSKFQKIRIFFYTKGKSEIFFNFFFKRIKLISLTRYEESKIFIKKKSIFYIIWQKIDEILDEIINKKNFDYIDNYKIDNLNLDKKKFRGFFKENSIYLLYYPIKLITFAKKFSSSNTTLFIIKKSPFSESIKSLNKINMISYFDLNFFYKKKYNLVYYEHYLKFYFFTRAKFLKIIFVTLKDFFLGIVSKKKDQNGPKIFLEVHQREIDFENITDFFWFKHTKLINKNVTAVLYNKYDKKSLKNLVDNNINYEYKNNLKISFSSLIKTSKFFFFILSSLFNLSFKNWEKCMFFLFYIKNYYWYEIFKNQNTKIFFTMIDIDDDKFAKLNAINLLNGISITSHWSNFPFCKINNKKCADVLLTWGEHFEESIFSKNNYKKIYKIGYPSDHYFKKVKEASTKLDKDKFIITYMDNILYNDGFYSPSTNVLIMKNFINLLEKNKKMYLYIKPKSAKDFNKYYGEKNKINKFIENGRIKVLFSKSYNEKFCPAEAASLSHLCVSLGIGTTSAESIFFGTPAFHYNNHNLNNKFIEYGKNKIVFNSIEDLFNAIEKSITNDIISINECKKISSVLDPYQDGHASKRAGFIINFIYNYLNKNDIKDEKLKLKLFLELEDLLKQENLFKTNYKF